MYIYIYAPLCIYLCMYACMYTYILYICIQIELYVYIYVCLYIWRQICMYIYIYICIYIYMFGIHPSINRIKRIGCHLVQFGTYLLTRQRSGWREFKKKLPQIIYYIYYTAYIHPNIIYKHNRYITTYVHRYIHACTAACMKACLHACIHSYMYVYIYTMLMWI